LEFVGAHLFRDRFERAFPGKSFKAVASKVAASNFFADPIFLFPTFYTFREVVSVGEDDPRGVGLW
jgi:hypothetical protein